MRTLTCIPREPEVFGHRIEIDAQLVGVLEVVRAHRVRVQVDATQVDDPGKLRRVAEHEFARAPTRGEFELHHFHPERARLRCALLVEELALDSVYVTLERHRPSPYAAQRAIRDREVVPDQVELGVPGLGKEDLVRVGDRDLPALDLQQLLARRHPAEHTDVE
jgi:hypothetical protein